MFVVVLRKHSAHRRIMFPSGVSRWDLNGCFPKTWMENPLRPFEVPPAFASAKYAVTKNTKRTKHAPPAWNAVPSGFMRIQLSTCNHKQLRVPRPKNPRLRGKGWVYRSSPVREKFSQCLSLSLRLYGWRSRNSDTALCPALLLNIYTLVKHIKLTAEARVTAPAEESDLIRLTFASKNM